MNNHDSPVTVDELHAYIDGELPSDRQGAVSDWLAAHPQDAELVAAWRSQAEAIRARYSAVADEPVPQRLQLERLLQNGRRSRWTWRVAAAAAAIVAFVAGGGAGWVARGASAVAPTSFDVFTADALEAYKLYVVEVRHPVEVGGDERAHMKQWLSKRVGYPLSVPELQSIGLKLVGGRLLPGPTGEAAAFYMYEGPSGERFTVYCARSHSPQTALRYRDGAHAAAFFWVEDNVAYVVSGPADRDRLRKVTKAVWEQIDGRKS
ncbi:MAG TPA: anti-sigma factor [Pseudolabrys sp.]|jgi:anti-sigma factor RsiW|nr:anti-sigma factor [Pseudolabrys sp.]